MSQTKGAIPFHIETQGSYPIDPRDRVGANRLHTSKEAIPNAVRYEGMMVVDDAGKLWMLTGGTTNSDYLDVFAAYETIANKNQANGYAGIGANGKLDPSVLPSLAIGDTSVVASEAEMLGLTAQTGDVAKRTDSGQTFILQGADPTVLANWVDISSNFSGIETINGKTGATIVLDADDIAETTGRKWVSQSEKDTWNAKQDALQYDAAPTFQSSKHLTSGAIFDALQDLLSSVWVKKYAGSDIDGNNRLNLVAQDESIQDVTYLTVNGVVQSQGDHYTVDENKRYIQFIDPTGIEADAIITLKYISNLPVLSLTTVAVANVQGLIDSETGKVLNSLLPAFAKAAADVDFDSTGIAMTSINVQAAIVELFTTKLGVQDLDVSDILQGEQKILTVTKNIEDNPEVGDAILLIDRFAPNNLLSQLDPALAWVDFERTITGDNSAGSLGESGQTIVATREKYDCVASDATSATWRIRFNSDTLEAAYSTRHANIISRLTNAAGWSNNFKIINDVNCFQGESFFDANEEGYMYVCLEQNGTSFTWKRMSQIPPTIELYFTAAEKGTLVTAIEAHDFVANGWYDQSVLAEADRAEVGRRYTDSVNENVYEVLPNNLIAKIL